MLGTVCNFQKIHFYDIILNNKFSIKYANTKKKKKNV